MGYSTSFHGEFQISPPLTREQTAYLSAFSGTRRMARNSAIAQRIPDPVREAVGLPIGTEGGYFVAGSGYAGQSSDESVIELNRPPQGQPGLWCQWVPDADEAQALIWDGGEKFYAYIEWLKYLEKFFFHPWGRTLSGEVVWQGEEPEDRGKIVCTATTHGTTEIKVLLGRVVYE